MPVANPVPPEPFRTLRGPGLDVSAGGECLALARKNDNPDVVVVLDLPAPRGQIVHHGSVQRIQFFGPGNPKLPDRTVNRQRYP